VGLAALAPTLHTAAYSGLAPLASTQGLSLRPVQGLTRRLVEHTPF
jgi:hypothetical protein